MSGVTVSNSVALGNIPPTWSVIGTGDFDGNGVTDIIWRSGTTLAIWLMNSTGIMSSTIIGNLPIAWTLQVTGDFNGDGKSDLLWQDSSGDTAIWFMNGAAILLPQGVGTLPGWSVQGVNAD